MRRWVCAVSLGVWLAGCDAELEDLLRPVPFSVQVVPAEMADTIPLQRCVLLVTVKNEGTGLWSGVPVNISASARWADVLVEGGAIRPGDVCEVTVIPDELDWFVDTDWTVTATIRAERGGLEDTVTVPVTITSMERDLVGPLAAEVRDLFLPWLAAERPELGITPQTEWTGTIVTPHILVVTHYLYFSSEWELHVFWHVMIPPYDWARIELRRRFAQTAPSLAFEIPSRSAAEPEVIEIEPEPTLWR